MIDPKGFAIPLSNWCHNELKDNITTSLTNHKALFIIL